MSEKNEPQTDEPNFEEMLLLERMKVNTYCKLCTCHTNTFETFHREGEIYNICDACLDMIFDQQ